MIDSIPEVRHVQAYANKAGIIKANNEIEGIVLKGMDSDFDPSFMTDYLVSGNPIEIDTSKRSNDIIISKTTADRLMIEIDDRIEVWFIQDPPRVRKLTVKGIYKTGLEEFDKIFAFMDIKHIQRLNDWTENDVGGFEVFLYDINDLDQVEEYVYLDVLGPDLYSQTIRDKHVGIFDWLNLQNANKKIILMLMIIIATINMITALLILILERTNMIGIMKSLGATNWTIRKVFIYYAMYILGVGLILGNTFAIVLLTLQKRTGFISLDEASYYLDQAPVDLNIGPIMLVNILTIVICFLVLLIPSYLITRITPVKAIRFS